MNLSFGHPMWLCALALLPLLRLAAWRNQALRARLLRQLVAARLEDRLAGNVSGPRRRLRFLLLQLGIACVVVSLAQPRLGYTWSESKRTGRDILVALDTSKSMLATDLTPSRLGRAKLALQDLLGQLHGDRVGLIAFAGSAFLQAPLTADYGAVLASLNECNTDIIPLGGTNIAAAIKSAEDAFGKGESDNHALILLTDGEELDADGVREAERVAGSIRIFTAGIGTNDGSLIPLPQSGGGQTFVKDENGNFVRSKLDEGRLQKIAQATGGFYVHLLNGPAEMQQIIRDGLDKMTEHEIDAKLSRQPIERYQWPLSVGLALLTASMLIKERRRAAGTAKIARPAATAAVLMLLLSPLAHATNKGVTEYENEDFAGAMSEFSKQIERKPDSEALHFDLGTAAYKAGELDRALQAFARAVTSPDPQLRTKAEYNLGNTLFQRGAALKDKEPKIREWKGALEHYDEALKVDPKNADAEYNRDVVRKMIEELQKEPPKNDQQQDKDKKDDKKQDDQKGDDKKDQSQNQNDQQQNQDKQQSGDSQQQNGGQQKDQQNPRQGDGKDQQPKNEKEQQGKDDKGQSKDGKDGDKQNQDGKSGEQPQPAPSDSGPVKQGDVGAASNADKSADADAKAEAAADAQAAAEGKMTEQQARALLDSLKGEDERVQLRDPNERKATGRVRRDW